MRRMAPAKSQREPTIALINIVFLMLVFFMVAGSLARPIDQSLTLVNTRDLDGRAPVDALVIHADGTLSYRGNRLEDAAAFVDALPEEDREVLRIMPDRTLAAERLVALTSDLRRAGASRILLVTERGMP